MTRYLTFDVFTDVAYGGNPLAVVPDAAGLPDAALQPIAREFNYSETTFVLPPRDPAHTALVRIFTPARELPFAGHPVVGTAVALAQAGMGPDMVFEIGIGPIAVRAEDGAARFTVEAPLEILSEPAAGDVAACLGLSPDRIAGRPVQASLGVPYVLVELTDAAALADCAPVADAFHTAAWRYPSDRHFPIYAWLRDGDDLCARMFTPRDGVTEDPATGSAAATLAAWLGDGDYAIRQGETMGRPSRIEVAVRGGAITVSGLAQPIMEGRILTLPAGDRSGGPR